jgi:hypothetical protein
MSLRILSKQLGKSLAMSVCCELKMKCSPVLRDIISQQIENITITFDDPKFETASVLRLFLDAIDGPRTSASTPRPPREHMPSYDDLLTFADKWDCGAVTDLLLYRICRWVWLDGCGPVGYHLPWCFIIAARCDELQLCTRLIKQADWGWGKESARVMGVKEDFHPLDPKGWSVGMVKRLPADYLWALTTLMHPFGAIKQPSAAEQSRNAADFPTLIRKWRSSK